MEIRTIGVAGSGQMGNGIAHVAAASGLDVILTDVDARQLAQGRATIEKNLSREVAKGKRTEEEKAAALGRIRTATDLAAFGDADLVIEAIVEQESAKKDLFRRLDRILRPDAILASNTSSISITRLAAASGRPDRFIGMHFMNPVPVMALVEVIRGMATSEETSAAVEALARRMGKTPLLGVDDFDAGLSAGWAEAFFDALPEGVTAILTTASDPARWRRWSPAIVEMRAGRAMARDALRAANG